MHVVRSLTLEKEKLNKIFKRWKITMSFMPCVSLCKLLTTTVIMYQFSIKNNMFIITPCSLLLLPISKHISAVFVFDASFKCFLSVTFHKLHLLFPFLSLKKTNRPICSQTSFQGLHYRHFHFHETHASISRDSNISYVWLLLADVSDAYSPCSLADVVFSSTFQLC